MGYTTDFEGSVKVSPPLSAEEVAFINRFAESRRMNRKSGPYTCKAEESYSDDDVIDNNQPPSGQPGLWCQWEASEDGTEIEWDGNEKFYNAAEWMEYIVEHFIGPDPVAYKVDPESFAFLKGHRLDGDILATGEDSDDHWKIEVLDSVVTRVEGHVTFEPEEPAEPPYDHTAHLLAQTRIEVRMARQSWDEQRQKTPGLLVHGTDFEILLRRLEEAAEIR